MKGCDGELTATRRSGFQAELTLAPHLMEPFRQLGSGYKVGTFRGQCGRLGSLASLALERLVSYHWSPVWFVCQTSKAILRKPARTRLAGSLCSMVQKINFSSSCVGRVKLRKHGRREDFVHAVPFISQCGRRAPSGRAESHSWPCSGPSERAHQSQPAYS